MGYCVLKPPQKAKRQNRKIFDREGKGEQFPRNQKSKLKIAQS